METRGFAKKLLTLAPILKACLTDIFMLYVPLLYVSTYVILGSAAAFRQNQSVIFINIAIYGILTALFFSIASQTPGYKYANIKLTRQNGKKVSFLLALLRFAIFLVSMGFVFGLVFPFFDKKTRLFHDVMCKTVINAP